MPNRILRCLPAGVMRRFGTIALAPTPMTTVVNTSANGELTNTTGRAPTTMPMEQWKKAFGTIVSFSATMVVMK